MITVDENKYISDNELVCDHKCFMKYNKDGSECLYVRHTTNTSVNGTDGYLYTVFFGDNGIMSMFVPLDMSFGMINSKCRDCKVKEYNITVQM